MTRFFTFDTLTWPEVANLDKTTPLVLPLGNGYEPNDIAVTLGNPPTIGLLPNFPFGWRGSGLEIHASILERYVKNLLDSLRDGGFSYVYALTSPGIDLALGDFHITLPAPFYQANFTLEQTDQNKVILFPIGHVEQHGFHLPLNTDTLIIEAICKGVEDSAPKLTKAIPVMPYGVSTHCSHFAGTMNAGGRAFEDFWIEILDTLTSLGYDRIYLNSGHGGNCSFLVNVVKYAGERHPNSFIATTFLYLTSPVGIEVLETYRQSPIGGMGHACELETSLILLLNPDLVYMDRVVDEIDFVTTSSYYMDWVEGGALIANPPWSDDTRTGAYGAGSLGTAEKGAIWLQAAILEKVSQVEEIHEQQTRRTQRRVKR
jgi:creatinine amidohydrolase